MQNVLLVPREVAPAASPGPVVSWTAPCGLAIVASDAGGWHRVEWLGREIGVLIPAGHQWRPVGSGIGDGAPPAPARPLPLDDAAAALLGAWLLAIGR